MSDINDFKGKLAIVTGSSKQNGIGYAVALALAKRGVDVRQAPLRIMLHHLIRITDCSTLQFQPNSGSRKPFEHQEFWSDSNCASSRCKLIIFWRGHHQRNFEGLSAAYDRHHSQQRWFGQLS